MIENDDVSQITWFLHALSEVVNCTDLAIKMLGFTGNLRAQFAIVHSRLKFHPSQGLLRREWQAESVEEIMITTSPAFQVFPRLLQSAHASSLQDVSSPAPLFERLLGHHGEGDHLQVRFCLALCPAPHPLWWTKQSLLEKLYSRHRIGREPLVLLHELLLQAFP